ncbi:MAG: hypothetical protein GY924_15840 [Planctomycetaceae bacterium]|nr:hypothetical protein [Planctomycetaceae bacterium]
MSGSSLSGSTLSGSTLSGSTLSGSTLSGSTNAWATATSTPRATGAIVILLHTAWFRFSLILSFSLETNRQR